MHNDSQILNPRRRHPALQKEAKMTTEPTPEFRAACLLVLGVDDDANVQTVLSSDEAWLIQAIDKMHTDLLNFLSDRRLVEEFRRRNRAARAA
jgi:hypothetical protein